MVTVQDNPSPAPSQPGRHKLPRSLRMTRQSDFDEAFASGDGFVSRTLVLKLRRADDAAGKVGVIASKRAFPLAVQRNRAKRLLREAFRLQRGRIAGGIDLVLMARQRILGAKRQDVERDFLHVLRKANALRAGAAPENGARANRREAEQ